MPSSMNIANSNFKIEAPLILPDDEVHLWRADLESLRGNEADADWKTILSSDELARASRFHFARDRQYFMAARAWLRKLLGGYLVLSPGTLTFTYSKKEKPSLAQPHSDSGIMFNVSHSGGVALYAFSRRHDVGVDIEKVRSDFDLEGIARRFFSAHEQRELAEFSAEDKAHAFFRCWTRKEAYIKATGDGLSLPLTKFDVSLSPGSKNALLTTRPDAAEADRWRLSEVQGGDGYAAAICVRGRDWKLKGWRE